MNIKRTDSKALVSRDGSSLRIAPKMQRVMTMTTEVLVTTFLIASVFVGTSRAQAPAGAADGRQSVSADKELLVRIAEIEVEARYLEEYKAIVKEQAEAALRVEPGVVSIFPMYQKTKPTEVRIVEIYASRGAYESHLQTPHFQKYKTTTLKMVKSLKLVDMEPIDAKAMTTIFGKMPTR
jgi:quinol monooxygenase YgiN